jgi:ribose transport system substrate-binding protein
MTFLNKFRVFAVLSAAAIAGCNKGTTNPGGAGSTPQAIKVYKATDPKSIKLAFVTNNVSDYWKLAHGGVNKFAKENPGVQVEFKTPPNGKPEEQNVILEQLVSQGYNGIAVSVVAPEDQVSNINAACAKTNVICVDSDSPKSARIEYVGTENYTAGKALGEAIVKLLPNGGKMAVFVGTLSADNARARLKGIEDAIAGHKIEIVAKKEDNTDQAKAQSNVEDVMNSTPDLNLVCGLWSYNGPAIASAIAGAHKEGKVLAAVFDQDAGTLKGIQDGSITLAVVQDPFAFGYECCKQLNDFATLGDAAKIPADHKILFPVQVIDKNAIHVDHEMNIDDYVKLLDAEKAS